MELVYLWVEDYKNIQKQGFNFSSKFICDYDEIKNELTIEDNPEHIPNFFGENINVTAIVGKNGSGKSSVLKCLKKYINNIHQRKEPPTYGHISNNEEWEKWKKNNEYYIDEKLLIVFYSKEDGRFYYQSSFKFDYKNPRFFIEEAIYLSTVSFPLFDYSLTYDKEISKMDEVFPQKYHSLSNQNSIIFEFEHNRNVENIIKNYFYLKNKFKIFENFFQPKKILLGIDLAIGFDNIIWTEETKKKLEYEDAESLIKKYFIDNPIGNITTERLSNKLENKKMSNLIKKYLEKYPEQKNTKVKKYKNNIYTVFELDIDELEYNKDEKYEIIERISYKSFENSMPEEYMSSEEVKSSKPIQLSSVGKIFDDLKYFSIDLVDEQNKSFMELSFGEQQLVDILNQIYAIGTKYYLYEADGLDEHSYSDVVKDMQIWDSPFYKKNIENFIIFFDEIDIGFHPDWQKRTIQYILDFLKLIPNKNFHLIFSTHSPFLLSDIPKENILFFGDKKIEANQTFGANIHTLLSDSFFMEDGLMGEFAKNKIRTIKVAYSYVLHRHKRKTLFTQSSKRSRRLLIKKLPKFWQIHKIIGEPFLQKIIKNQLEEIELILLGKNEAIDNEIKRLEDLKKSLKND
ncbi:MAG: Unknown protein [uncultured Sulfurovum sp.]|uniref:ATPase AAA-type core domain-containing protein n=1 Tax=uncultured Sulfurovum sp. TaxID=269237 RepID=A0A6S6SIM8_9BACT|nr:MAG: Unknown protein [uncultured Sulfurovum sp.]